MNRRLEQLIKTIDVDPTKTKFIVLNGAQTTKDNASQLMEILKMRGHTDVTVLMVAGDVRSACEVFELDNAVRIERGESTES